MMETIFSLLLIFISLLMFFLNHPLSMGLMLLTQTLITCLISGMLMKTYWFSYILFLTFLGGLLVLFIYVSSIASNELFKISPTMKSLIFLFWTSLLILSILIMNNMNWMNLSINSDMTKIYDIFMFFNNENNINLTKLYNNQTYFLMLIMMIYLFITLVAIVKITNIFYGPLRSNL
uniref:NADH-ubiquinone oxidoreductase chain 6 n=1 Tax=Zeuzera multistrigata TaxID=1928443 RepID=A0A7R6AM19_9NEOP|nr:NADH dehydrogenase subunit 6 [Zeuzera multistrigata]APO08613.1 NADH dehydrogenase subunit 6 [Zeuzera multistrigata]